MAASWSWVPPSWRKEPLVSVLIHFRTLNSSAKIMSLFFKAPCHSGWWVQAQARGCNPSSIYTVAAAPPLEGVWHRLHLSSMEAVRWEKAYYWSHAPPNKQLFCNCLYLISSHATGSHFSHTHTPTLEVWWFHKCQWAMDRTPTPTRYLCNCCNPVLLKYFLLCPPRKKKNYFCPPNFK